MQFAQTPEDWVTITKIIKQQRHKGSNLFAVKRHKLTCVINADGLARAKGFQSFENLEKEPLSALGGGQGLSGLGEQKLKSVACSDKD